MIDVERLGEAMDAVMPDLRGSTKVCEEHHAYLPLGDPETGDQLTPGDFAAAVAAQYAALTALAEALEARAAE